MIRGFTASKIALGITILAAPMGVNACATGKDLTTGQAEAVLLNPQDSLTRQAIRVFVREQSGGDLIVDPDSLARVPVLAMNKRQTRNGLNSRRDSGLTRNDLKPTGEYKLVMDSEGRCYLNHRTEEATTQIALPESAMCKAYSLP